MSNRGSGVGSYSERHIGNGKSEQMGDAQPTGEERSAIGTMPLQEAGYQALRPCFKRWRKALASLEDLDDVEAVHDARVAVREIRAMSKLLRPSPCFNGPWLRRLDKGLGELSRTLGTVRDTDVYLDRLRGYTGEQKTANEGLNWLEQALLRRRKKAAKQVIRALDAGKTRRLQKQARREVEKLRQANAKTNHTSPVLLRHFAGSAIWARYQDLLSYETALPEANAVTLHKLRIDCKRLRYSLQIFGKTPDALSELVSALKAVQDQLGQLHDTYYAEQLAQQLQGKWSPNTRMARREYREFMNWLDREGGELRSGMAPLWNRLVDLPMRQAIAGFIASL